MNQSAKTPNTRLIAGVVLVTAITVAVVALVRLDVQADKGSGLSTQFTYDTTQLGRIEPDQILYAESSGPIATGFDTARALAVDAEENIFVVGDHGLRVFDDAGRRIGEVTFEDEPQCPAIADDGTIYVAMRSHVEVLDGGLKPVARWQDLGDRAVLTSIAVGSEDVFVADAGNRVVLRYDRSGNLLNTIGEKDAERNIPGFVIPSAYFDLAVGRDGLLRVTSPGRHRIEAYTADGDIEFWWGRFSMNIEGFCGCCNPTNFAILPDGSFVTTEKGLTRVKVYDSEGNFVGVVAGPEQLLEVPVSRLGVTPTEDTARGFDVAVDQRGRILVLDTIANTIRTFTKKAD